MINFTSPKALVGAVTSGVLVLGLGITGLMSVEVVGQGERGVVYSRADGVQEVTLGQGWNIVSPLEKVTKYPVSTTTVKYDDLSLSTRDGKPLTVSITYDYFNDTEKLPKIYDKFKGAQPESIEKSWLKARLSESALSVTSQYTVLEVFQKREEIRTEILAKFQEDVKGYGFEVENLVFGNPTPDKATQQAIQNVVNRQQELEALKVEKQKAQVEAEKKAIEAKGNSEASLIEARAKAKANEILDKSLTGALIKYEYIKKWDGKEPSTKVNGTSDVIINGK